MNILLIFSDAGDATTRYFVTQDQWYLQFHDKFIGSDDFEEIETDDDYEDMEGCPENPITADRVLLEQLEGGTDLKEIILEDDGKIASLVPLNFTHIVLTGLV